MIKFDLFWVDYHTEDNIQKGLWKENCDIPLLATLY